MAYINGVCYNLLSGRSYEIICLLCLSYDFHIGLQAGIFLAGTHSAYSNWMSEHGITHVAVKKQLFTVLHWPRLHSSVSDQHL